MGYVLFGETFGVIAFVGIVTAVTGFALANR